MESFKKQVLCSREDIRKIEEEEQINFIFAIILAIGVPEKDVELCQNDPTSIEGKILLRKLCEKHKITIVDDLDRNLKIYKEIILSKPTQHQVAEWKKPWIRLHYDHSELIRSKRYYVEINFEYWISL